MQNTETLNDKQVLRGQTEPKKNTYFISGGGTGGHIYPAIAIALALIEEGNEVYFVGNQKNLEYKICNENKIKFLNVDVGYMPRRLGFGLILWAVKTFFASLVAAFYVLKYRPRAVFATGGYVSAPVLIASTFLFTPFMTHDCDAVPGLVSRVFSVFSRATSVAFEEAKKYLKTKRAYFLGNPIRAAFFTTDKESARKALALKNLPTVLIMGGSQGAKSLNTAAIDAIEHFRGNENLQIILQTGVKNYEEVLTAVGKIPNNTTLAAYFDDLSVPLSAADLVISRAGSLSISEICALGLPSILVPYPFAAANHQKKNAQIMQETGASICLEDQYCKGSNLIRAIDAILFDAKRLNAMKQAAIKHSKPDATKDIVDTLKSLGR